MQRWGPGLCMVKYPERIMTLGPGIICRVVPTQTPCRSPLPSEACRGLWPREPGAHRGGDRLCLHWVSPERWGCAASISPGTEGLVGGTSKVNLRGATGGGGVGNLRCGLFPGPSVSRGNESRKAGPGAQRRHAGLRTTAQVLSGRAVHAGAAQHPPRTVSPCNRLLTDVPSSLPPAPLGPTF